MAISLGEDLISHGILQFLAGMAQARDYFRLWRILIDLVDFLRERLPNDADAVHDLQILEAARWSMIDWMSDMQIKDPRLPIFRLRDIAWEDRDEWTHPFVCTFPGCNKRFAYTWHLRDHRLTHLPIGTPQKHPFPCMTCHKAFTKKCNLDSHLLTHLNSTPYKCTICGLAMNNRSNLNKHFKLHKGLKAYQCSQCSYRTAKKSNLMSHERARHSDLKPYECPHCEYRTAIPSNLRRHVRAKHS